MSKNRRLKTGSTVWRASSVEMTLLQKPRYNAFSCGHGPHGDAKYNRAREKQRWMNGEGLQSDCL